MNPTEALEQISYLIFLKRLEEDDNKKANDAMLEEKEFESGLICPQYVRLNLIQVRMTDQYPTLSRLPQEMQLRNRAEVVILTRF